MFADALVDALVAAADEQQTLVARKLGDERAVEPPPLRREQHHRRLCLDERLHRLDGGEQRLRLHHHPRAAAERVVIDRPMPVSRPVAQVVQHDLDQPRVARAPHDRLVERPREHAGKQRQDVEAHRFILAHAAT